MNIIVVFLFLTLDALAMPVHLDLEMSSLEYRKILREMESTSLQKSKKQDPPAIRDAIAIGERLFNWIELINSHRSSDQAIRLTSKDSRRGIPIDKPNLYSPEIIKNQLDEILSQLPATMLAIVMGEMPPTAQIPLKDEEFIELARKIDRQYQSAARYKSIDQYRSYYIQAAKKDVRGYYYLNTQNINETYLKDVHQVPQNKWPEIKKALLLICQNANQRYSQCQNEFERAYDTNSMAAFYQKYFLSGKINWESFYKIPDYAKRSDVRWENNKLLIGFNKPAEEKIRLYLKNNIEQEWMWKGWNLQLIFGSYPSGPFIKFEAGVVPHVNRLGGNEIVMDSNQSIEEYESQWIIRHEFGHVLGLPDCYHEFYDQQLKAYVNYQLDITDLMCSRAGNMNERLFKVLQKNYSIKTQRSSEFLEMESHL